ncbi:leucyl/phenylalanyl-tRNA--protein transferase [Achromobacter sp. GG226]|uniref:leucyl/phenylalanyl-tRNA--protein transferase n=1 Tax=Verticiella alkaliphila TaxID=2779529 RepID=UPI001C0BDD66|nr:leucyl/phenylalanyl-tRNA--protein transferase [Verticiella sp. GG226]
MRLTLLGPDTPFPPAERALREPDGLLAVGGDLSVARLRAAYASGIFPWYSEGQPILWWSPDPRMLLRTANFHPGRQLRKKLNRLAAGTLAMEVRVDTAFGEVLEACAAPRDGQPGTWILPPMQRAYRAWHVAGDVHSVETWIDGRLAGGLYGVALGGMFFGESMFTRVDDAAKIALACLARFVERHGAGLIDCQQDTPHMARMGAAPVARTAFLASVREAIARPAMPWARGRLTAEGVLVPASA